MLPLIYFLKLLARHRSIEKTRNRNIIHCTDENQKPLTLIYIFKKKKISIQNNIIQFFRSIDKLD